MEKVNFNNILIINSRSRKVFLKESGFTLGSAKQIFVAPNPNLRPEVYRTNAGNQFFFELMYSERMKQTIVWETEDNGGIVVDPAELRLMASRRNIEFYDKYQYPQGTRNG